MNIHLSQKKKFRLSVRAATPEDIPLLSILGVDTYRETFIEDFGIIYPPSDEADFCRKAYGERSLRRLFECPDFLHFIGELDGKPLGYALVGKNTLPHQEARASDGEFKRLYVKREAQGVGLGRALFDVGMTWLEKHFPGPVWLGVWEGNRRAQQFYSKQGFVRMGEYTFRVGKTEELDWILRRP